jgi:hypothetical protein
MKKSDCPAEFKKSNGKCVREFCPEGFKKTSDDKCVRSFCKKPFVEDEKSKMCVKKTRSCPPFTVRVKGTNKCRTFKCPSDYKWNGKKCIKSTCPPNYVLNEKTDKCEWMKCEDKTYVYNKKTKICEKRECKDKTFTYNPKTEKCEKKTCEPGFIYDETNGVCVKMYCKNGFVLEMLTKTPKCVLVKTIAPPTLVDPSDLTLTTNVHKMMLWFGQLESRTQTDVFGCELNLKPAFKRCENDHGKDGCQQITPTFVNKKCPEGTKAWGASKCVKKCPNEWQFDDKGLYCMKKHSYRVDTFKKEEECKKNKWWTSCVRTSAGVYVPICKEGYTKTGATLCRPSCPNGFTDLGTMCVKPTATDLGLPYTWANGDN